MLKKPARIASVGSECVACGSCTEACPMEAICIDSGVTALIDEDKCVGCGRCAGICPAGVITIVERRAIK